eukprot:TRINITY_DN4173_c0_g2_i1.p1 TRINITY_DN4173_c0_g2~~TRINITY_DN4173_c0_g2_i1.p1  ORF type:complete len:107 (+),score=6.68 TRINITY_DN4173_c0_g2_i1:648-968(+)
MNSLGNAQCDCQGTKFSMARCRTAMFVCLIGGDTAGSDIAGQGARVLVSSADSVSKLRVLWGIVRLCMTCDLSATFFRQSQNLSKRQGIVILWDLDLNNKLAHNSQ